MKLQRNSIQKMKLLDETPIVQRLPRSDIRPDPGQPRKKRNREKLEGLAKTILVKQLQPILIRAVDGETPYMIVVGEGRWLAAGINEEITNEEQYLDCIVVDESNISKIRSMQLIENIQREDMNELEIAAGWRELIELGEYKTAKEVADAVGVSAASVSVAFKVLDAPEPIRQLVEKGITKLDTARTLMMIAELNKERADALVQAANESGELKRKDVRSAYAEEQAKAENAAAAAEATQDAAALAQVDAGTTNEGAGQALQLDHADEQAAGGQGDAAQPEQQSAQVVQLHPAAPVATPQEAHQKPVAAAPQASTPEDKGAAPKAPETAANRVAPVIHNPPAAAPASAPQPQPAAQAPEQLGGAPDATEQPPESPMVTTEKFDVIVSIRSGSVDEDRFIGLTVEYGDARLASHVVHRDPSRAWVEFGTKGRDYVTAFKCGDLEIVKVVQRG